MAKTEKDEKMAQIGLDLDAARNEYRNPSGNPNKALTYARRAIANLEWLTGDLGQKPLSLEAVLEANGVDENMRKIIDAYTGENIMDKEIVINAMQALDEVADTISTNLSDVMFESPESWGRVQKIREAAQEAKEYFEKE